MSMMKEINATGTNNISIHLSEAAIAQIKNAVAVKGEDYQGMRVGVKTRGCSGMAYEVKLLEQGAADKEKDYLFSLPDNLWIAIDKADYSKFLSGLIIDFSRKGLQGNQFNFINPNEQGSCGCGESFMVKDKPQ